MCDPLKLFGSLPLLLSFNPHKLTRYNTFIANKLIRVWFTGYDQIPIDSMQGLEIGSGFGMDMDIGETEGAGAASTDLVFPEPPHDNNNVAAWYDTDL